MSQIIQKTSDEEGKYAEYIVKFLSKAINADYKDVSDDSDYQRQDIDALINGLAVEIKNDTVIWTTKNAVYEKITHAHKKDVDIIKSILDSTEYVKHSDIPDNLGSIGCNEKCEATHIFYVSTIEDINKPKHYKLNWKDPIFIINNKKLKNYVKNTSFYHNDVKIVWQQEDKAWNIIILLNIDNLIKEGIARRLNQNTIDILKTKENVFSEAHTSKELENLLLD